MQDSLLCTPKHIIICFFGMNAGNAQTTLGKMLLIANNKLDYMKRGSMTVTKLYHYVLSMLCMAFC